MRREQRYQKAQDGGWRILLTDRGGQKRPLGLAGDGGSEFASEAAPVQSCCWIGRSCASALWGAITPRWWSSAVSRGTWAAPSSPIFSSVATFQ